MTDAPENDRVGYCNPPKRTRWKKGQSGNSRDVRPKHEETMIEMIDRLLITRVKIILNGATVKIPALSAIMNQLLQKSLSGDKKAQRALREFEAFASRNMKKRTEVVFVDNEYTDAFSAARPENEGG